MAWLTIQAAKTTNKAEEKGSIAPAKAANAANGVAHRNAKLASAQAAVSSKRQKNGATRPSMGVNNPCRGAGWRRPSDNMESPFASDCFFHCVTGVFPPSGRAGMLLVGFYGIVDVTGRKPGFNGLCRRSRRFDLAESNPQSGAAEPIV
jgi:hypothetical protein